MRKQSLPSRGLRCPSSPCLVQSRLAQISYSVLFRSGLVSKVLSSLNTCARVPHVLHVLVNLTLGRRLRVKIGVYCEATCDISYIPSQFFCCFGAVPACRHSFRPVDAESLQPSSTPFRVCCRLHREAFQEHFGLFEPPPKMTESYPQTSCLLRQQYVALRHDAWVSYDTLPVTWTCPVGLCQNQRL